MPYVRRARAYTGSAYRRRVPTYRRARRMPMRRITRTRTRRAIRRR